MTSDGEGIIERVLAKGCLVWIHYGKRYRGLRFFETKELLSSSKKRK